MCIMLWRVIVLEPSKIVEDQSVSKSLKANQPERSMIHEFIKMLTFTSLAFTFLAHSACRSFMEN